MRIASPGCLPALVSLTLTTLVSCSPIETEDGEVGTTTSAGSSSTPLASDVIIISIDCMRADHVGAYGYERNTTPVIDSIARDGIRFDRAYAQANWTKPSVASLMTGLYVRNHGVVVGTDYFDEEGHHKVGSNSFPLPSDLPLISEAFREIGYETAGFVENSHLVPGQGFARGFDTYEKVKPAAKRLQKWISALESEAPFFAYLHLIGPHDPYDGGHGEQFATEYRNRFGEYESEIDWTDLSYKKKVKSFSDHDLLQANALYDAELNYFDQVHVSPLIDFLKENGRYPEALIVITSDHGEELQDHGRWAHGHSLYNEVTRIPLIVKLPASTQGLPAGTHVSEVVEQIGVFPTLCNLVGCETPDQLDGRSFAQLLVGGRAEDPNAYAVSEFGKGVRAKVLAASIVQGDSKWVEFYPPELGPVLQGPTAPKNDMNPMSILLDARTDEILSRVEHDVPHPMRTLLKRAVGESPAIRHELVTSAGYSQDQIEELRALGYVE